MWKKPDIAASSDLWNSFSLRGTIGGIDQKVDDSSFYAGMKLYREGEIKAAIDIWEGTRMMLLTRSSPKAVARTMAVVCGYLGDAYFRLIGKYHDAVEFHINNLNFAEEIRYQCGKDFAMSESHEAAINLLPAVGHAQTPVSGTSKSTAIDYHRQRLEYARCCSDKIGETEASRGLGHTVRWFDGHEASLVEWEEKMKHALKFGDYQTACGMMDKIGQAHLTENRRVEALEWFNRGLKEASKHGDNLRIAQAQTNIGCTHRQMGKVSKAVTCHESAVAALYKVGDREALGKAYLELSSDYHALLPSKYKYGIGRLGSKDKSAISLPWG